MKTPQVTLFITMDPIRDGNNWYTYVQNDPVNYVDLWGVFSFKEVGNQILKTYTLVSRAINTAQLLGQSVSEPVESEYKKQFTTEAEQEKSWLSVLSWVGTIPGPIGTAFSVLTDAAALNNSASNDIVVFNSRKAFIVGAEAELQRLKYEIANQTTSTDFPLSTNNQNYAQFLNEQKRLLENEIAINKLYDRTQEVFDNGRNRPQEPESWVTSVDYKSTYKNK